MTTRFALTASLVVALALGGSARAHVVYGTPSLHDLVRSADVAVRVRIVDPLREVRVEHPRLARPVVEAVVLETLRGERMARVTFAPHGHGAAAYHAGEEALVFLHRLDRVPELAATPLAGRVRWASLQETTDKIPLGSRSRRVWVDAVRRYLDAEAPSDPARRQAALRGTTLVLLGSEEPRIAASALRDLVRAGEAPLVTRDDLPRLEALLASETVATTVRVGLLAELERRGLVEGPPRWARLLGSARGRDQLVVILSRRTRARR